MSLPSLAVDAVFVARGKTATYTPPGGGPGVACLVLLDRRDPDEVPGQGRPSAGRATIKVRASQVASPAATGTFFVPAQAGHPIAATYAAIDRPRAADPDGFVWVMTAR